MGKQALSNILSLTVYYNTHTQIVLAIKCLVDCFKPTKWLYSRSCHQGIVMELGYPCYISTGIITSSQTNSSFFTSTKTEWLGLPGRSKKIHGNAEFGRGM